LKEPRTLIKYDSAIRVDGRVAIIGIYAVKDDPLFHR
jgi:hypothetical protein